MKINIYTKNKKLSKNYEKSIQEYIKRLSPYCQISFYTYKDKLINYSDFIIVVNSNNALISSEDLSDKIKHIMTYDSSKISFILSDDIESLNIQRIDYMFALSKFTLSNSTSQILISEQIYRAFNIINGKKYHK